MPISYEFDVSVPPFPAPLRKWLVNGSNTYKIKCLSIGPLLYILGVLITYNTNTLNEFINDFIPLIACIVSSITLFGIVYATKQIGPVIKELDKRIEHSRKKRFQDFILNIKYERSWCYIPNRYWYYLHTYGLALSLLIAIHITGNFGRLPSWVVIADGDAQWVNYLYFLLAITLIGFFAGLAADLAWEYAYHIHTYCNDFVNVDSIKLYPPEEAGGLKPLGKLAFKMNIAVVTPVFYVLSWLYKLWAIEGKTILATPTSLLYLLMYVLFLATIFIYPIYPAHKALVKAKVKEITHIDELIRQNCGTGSLSNPQKYELLNNLLVTRNNLNKFLTWPLDVRLSIGSAISILFPLIGGAILQIWFELLFKLL